MPLDSDQAVFNVAGGKGANLSRLARAGFPVPDGFVLSTAAYQAFLSLNHLEGPIQTELSRLGDLSAENLESCSQRIRALFEGGRFPPDLDSSLQAVYLRLGAGAVAVRSSATAEDLPDLSFAGQQDTYLNVVGYECLREAVIHCWSSLWTARAIGYRARNGVDQRGLSLAVVVQQMVESRASGVLFTANPLNGLRRETVIDAALGLGEALVSGLVEPDHYVVDPAGGRIVSIALGAKSISIHGAEFGGVETAHEERGEVQALGDDQILELARMGQKVQELYGQPQDIEWAEAHGMLYLLQSRPITSLFPTPQGMPPEPLRVFFSFGAVQGVLEPITPLGRDVWIRIFSRAASMFGIQVTSRTQTFLREAGERLWINFTTPLSNEVGRKVIRTVIDAIEPGIGQALKQIWQDERLQPVQKGIRPHARVQIARFAVPIFGNVLLNLLSPGARRRKILASGEKILEQLRLWIAELPREPHDRLVAAASLLDRVYEKPFLPMLRGFLSGVISGVASWNLLFRLVGQIPTDSPEKKKYWGDQALELTRGMPNNPTTEMDLALWNVARAVRADPESLAAARDLPANNLAQRFLAARLPFVLQKEVAAFLNVYGLRGFVEIDIGRTRWAQNPAPIFEMLSSFLLIAEDANAPDAVFRRSAGSAEQAVERIVQGVRSSRRGWIKARLARFLAGRARQLMGMRENPKFFAVRLFGLIQAELLGCGRDLARAGELERGDDLFYLTFDEIKEYARSLPEAAPLVRLRRAAYQREMLRRQIPRVLLSNGRAFYTGITPGQPGQATLMGSPVSPGTAEGRVRVVFDPHVAHLQPGEILVCPGTDPSWTPLFLLAAGLVMEVGGMMTHGAVVAREYGIPAIVGVDRATEWLKTGDLVRIDGSSGLIVRIEATATISRE